MFLLERGQAYLETRYTVPMGPMSSVPGPRRHAIRGPDWPYLDFPYSALISM